MTAPERERLREWLSLCDKGDASAYDGPDHEDVRNLLDALDEAERALRWIADRQDDSRKPHEIARKAFARIEEK